MTIVKPCLGCKPHAYQDNKYGDKLRVHNTTKSDKDKRCTVCGKQTPA